MPGGTIPSSPLSPPAPPSVYLLWPPPSRPASSVGLLPRRARSVRILRVRHDLRSCCGERRERRREGASARRQGLKVTNYAALAGGRGSCCRSEKGRQDDCHGRKKVPPNILLLLLSYGWNQYQQPLFDLFYSLCSSSSNWVWQVHGMSSSSRFSESGNLDA
jgi:hypothetical protein